MFLLRKKGESCAPSCVMLLYALEHNDGELLQAVCAMAVEKIRADTATKLLKNIVCENEYGKLSEESMYGLWVFWPKEIARQSKR